MVIDQHISWGALLLGALMVSGLLEAGAQQPPEFLELTTSHVTLSHDGEIDDIRILKGTHTEPYIQGESSSIMGFIKRGSGTITFTPLVPFNQDRPYTVICDGTALQFMVERSQDHRAIEVLNIYPTAKEVPANILKWYVHFSRPVNPVKIYDHIHFLDHEGNAIDRSILHLKAPLLSADGTLLTIWIEPGRQKQLLGPNSRLGSVFEPHQSYTLHIDGAIKDIEGIVMGSTVRHQFMTTDTDRVKPSIEDWKVSDIIEHTLEPLLIMLPEQVDFGSLTDAFGLYNQGSSVEGTLDYNSEGNTISFRPTMSWQAGTYTIQMAPQLEDLAGNNLQRLFDHSVGEEDSVKNSQQNFIIQLSSK